MALVRDGRARMVVLGIALFAVPGVVLLDDSGSATAITLAVITGIAAVAVAWRITRIVDESNNARVVLGASEARFRALVQHATDIVMVLDERGEVTYVSPAVDTVFGRPADELIGSSFVDYLDAARHRPEPGALPDARRPPGRTGPHRVRRARRRQPAVDRGDVDQPAPRARGPGHRRQPP